MDRKDKIVLMIGAIIVIMISCNGCYSMVEHRTPTHNFFEHQTDPYQIWKPGVIIRHESWMGFHTVEIEP